MKRNAMSLILTLATLAAPAAFGMHYATGNANPTPILMVPDNLLIRPENNVSACTSDSNTIAVGYDIYSTGFRILCADAGRIGFWTTPVAGALVGQESQSPQRFLCPSGSALGGLQYVEGLIYPLALCGELIPDFSSGMVSRKVLFNVDKVVVMKLSKSDPPPIGVVPCGPVGYVQSLRASRNASGAVTGFASTCNQVLTAPANLEDVNVDLAVRTVDQSAVLGRNANDLFRVEVFNLGISAIPASNVSVEFRFDGMAWQVQQFADTACTDILAHKGVIDLIVVGKRCTLPGSVLAGRGGVVPMSFLLEPLGPEVTRPATPTPQPIFSVKVSLIDEHLEGADPNATNDLAAFPVVLQ